MKYTELGKTGLKPSVISFGGIPIQRDTKENAVELIDVLEKAGVNYLDTAKAYGSSEEYIGNALRGRREKFYLASKAMPRDYAGMKRDIEDSLAKFQTDYIDLYQVHNCPVDDFEKVFAEEGAYKALLEAREAGRIRHIGVTAHHVEDLELVLEKYTDKFETIMFPFNIVEDQGAELLGKLKAAGLGTIAMKPFAGGNLEDPDLALRYILHSGIIDIAIPGMGNPKEAEECVAVMDNPAPLTEEEFAEVERIRKELGTQFCRRCGYCLPCSVGINIPTALLYRNYVLRYHMKDWAQGRYDDTLSVKASECIECGICESRCPYNLPIREMMKDTAEIFD